tara:strand:+ start:34 stop:942 length:909 start_codon:yes stop_codon:yes gene_type:complete
MNNDLSELTVIILTHKTDDTILENCLSSIDSEVKIILIENSSNFANKEEIEKKYKNISIHCSGSNLGYGGGNNFGLNLIKSNYALILNPDTICEKNFFKKIQMYLNNNIDYAIIGSRYREDNIYKPGGFFDKSKTLDQAQVIDKEKLLKVDWVVGCSMLINLKKFDSKTIFDENYFLFFEETDLCKSLKKRGESVFLSTNLIIDHLGFKGSFLSDSNYEIEALKLRNWHFMWSFFYYHKKNDGYFKALKFSLGKFIRSFFKMLFFTLTFNKKQKINYLYRFLGLLNSMIGKKSWYRINDQEN